MNRAARTGLAVSVVSAVLFSGFFFAAHADHDCRGEDCSLCLLARGRPEPPCAWPSREAPAFPSLRQSFLPTRSFTRFRQVRYGSKYE